MTLKQYLQYAAAFWLQQLLFSGDLLEKSCSRVQSYHPSAGSSRPNDASCLENERNGFCQSLIAVNLSKKFECNPQT